MLLKPNAAFFVEKRNKRRSRKLQEKQRHPRVQVGSLLDQEVQFLLKLVV